MKSIKLFSILLLLVISASAQDMSKYNELVKQAWQYYENKDYMLSALTYEKAFASLENKGTSTDRYNAACSWALTGVKDSAFKQLFYIADKSNYSNYNHISVDTDLTSLHNDSRWNELLTIIKANKEKEEANYDKELVAILDTIYQSDQKYRMQIEGIKEKYGWESDEMKELLNKMSEADSINLIHITKILDERGWLGTDIIGKRGNSTLFLVIQHADIKTQEKYLPMMREAVKKGNAPASSLALLEDRVALRQGKKQIYGSQIGTDKATGEYYVLPLEDPDHVNERRTAVGLQPLEDYVSNWDIKWDVEEYKKQLKDREDKENKK